MVSWLHRVNCLVWFHRPFHEGNGAILDFKTGNAARMDTASGIGIMGGIVTKSRSVSMSCNKIAVMMDCPV